MPEARLASPEGVAYSRPAASIPAARGEVRRFACRGFRELRRVLAEAFAVSRKEWLWKPERLRGGQHLTTRTARLSHPIGTPSYVLDLLKPT